MCRLSYDSVLGDHHATTAVCKENSSSLVVEGGASSPRPYFLAAHIPKSQAALDTKETVRIRKFIAKWHILNIR